MPLTTPEDRFKNLPDYPFAPNYLSVAENLKMHYLDEGTGPTVLLLHGEPSWSYLYRKMIPIIVKGGFRVIVPDLIGFGKSDKLEDRADYSYASHLQWLRSLLTQLALQDILLFCQDWGGLLGLRIAGEQPDLFSKIIAANTILPTGYGKPSAALMQWKDFSQKVPEFPVAGVINMGTTTELSPEVLAAYDAPFPDESYKEGARIFPNLIPLLKDDPEAIKNQKAWEILTQWQKPFLTLFSDSDPIMDGMEKIFLKSVPGTAGQAHTIIKNAGHFLQEDKGEEIAEHCVRFFKGS